MKNFLKTELTGWKVWEVCWLVIAIVIILALSLYWQDTPMGIISATTGVACVVCTGKGKLSAYIFGLVNSILYAIIAYQSTYYGETMLNAIYYVPMQFVGFFIWAKNMNQETKEVKKQHMKVTGRLLTLGAIILSTVLYGLILKAMGDAMPYVDSFTTVSSVIAMIVSVKMYSEQWWIWVGVNIFTIYMWWTEFVIGGDNIATLLMWCVYLINSVMMLIKWETEARRKV
ncbi:MAG: nicotinamide mononucleotide transporter [Ruminococcaceae bacterium]|nr:nicotinamide mononucleotide transporter [Oscillospiraceae bacterium]